MPFPPKTLTWAQSIRKKILEEEISLESIVSEQPLSFVPLSLPEIQVEFHKKQQVVRTSPQKNLTKKDIAQRIYHDLTFAYGFKQALESGNWSPWPDECVQVNCYLQSVANYVVAQECDLQPYVVEFVGFQRYGDDQRASHSLVVVDVGDNELWVIDQPQRMFGPVKIDDKNNLMIVENYGAQQERTYRNDYKTHVFSYLQTIVSDEDAICDSIAEWRKKPAAVLFPGQRIGIPFVDAWQSEEPVEAPWFIRYYPKNNVLVSRILMNRPGIKSRGLEYQLANEKEECVGYYCDGMVWSDFTQPIPMMRMPVEQLSSLIQGLSEMPLKEHSHFEKNFLQNIDDPRTLAARNCFEEVQKGPYGELIMALSAVEALFLQERGEREFYLTKSERSLEINKLKHVHPLFAMYAKDAKDFARDAKILRQNIQRRGGLHLLRPEQREHPDLALYLSLSTEQERLTHVLEKRPMFITDAIDKLIFYERRIRGNEGTVMDMVERKFKERAQEAIFEGYGRIFAEFLGHFSCAFKELTLKEYKEKIVSKINGSH